MRVPTSMGLAFVNAAATAIKKKGDTPNNWVARAIAEKVDHTPAGTKPLFSKPRKDNK